MSSDNSLGVFEEQVMLAVLHAREDAYGMNVRREIETRTGREVAIGAVYATLDRLEQKGLIASARVLRDHGRHARAVRDARDSRPALAGPRCAAARCEVARVR
jgi:predicted transcriptional regulator